nr:glycosyltransferase family 4 protein [Martelella sp.]
MAASVISGQPVLVFNHGQTVASFIRMGLPHLVLRGLLPRRKIITSLHGSVFMTWQRDSRKTRFFLRLLDASDEITVLGALQREKLIELGVPARRLKILPNTADLDISPEGRVLEKHRALAVDPVAPVVLMHLSLLIESKGYVRFLEACRSLVEARDGSERPLEILLVGPMAFTAYCTKFRTPETKRDWIVKEIAALNAAPGVSARWIEGAEGAEKAALFDAAHLFAFPSRYPVEAQPLVLLEAMAAGCALITSDQGEIPSTVGNDTGLCLSDTSVTTVTQAMRELLSDHDRRISAALAAHHRAAELFSARTYCENWENLLAHSDQENAK